jgi:hypothetical protein
MPGERGTGEGDGLNWVRVNVNESLFTVSSIEYRVMGGGGVEPITGTPSDVGT